MYLPPEFGVNDQEQIFSFIEHYDFATLITLPPGGTISVTHLPLVLKRIDGSHAVLQGHMARANDHWLQFDGILPALAIFHGPHGYVSPTWYERGPAVPTWNYAVVHAHGRPRTIENRDAASAVLESLVRKYEDHRPRPWRMQDLPSEFRDHMVSRITAFEMPIDRIEAKFKLGQNRVQEDREGTVRGLVSEKSAGAATMRNSFNPPE
jgi:transcriptional regulator